MLVTTQAQLEEIIGLFSEEKTVVVDLETTGLHPYLGDRLCGLALYLPNSDISAYIPFRHGNGFNFTLDDLQRFRDVLSDPSKVYFGWNVKFDQHFLMVEGFPILENRAVYSDVMIALHLLDENRYDPADKRGLNYKLKDNARLFLGVESAEAEDELNSLLKANNWGKGELWRLDSALVSRYAEDDVRLTWQLYNVFLPYLEKWNQVALFEEKCYFNSQVLARMEKHGVPVDQLKAVQHIYKAREQAETDLKILKQELGQQFNPNSPVQIKTALGTKDGKRITLERHKSETANRIMDYKNLTKAEGTFYKPYINLSSFDGRIHPTFNVARTNSGRLSSSDPNLQQVPRYSEKYKVKEVFTSLQGYKLVQFDYSQQELRLACHFSGQENMTDEFLKNEADVHSLTTAQLFGITYAEAKLDKEKRTIGKITNFGFCYGMGILKAATYIASSLKKALLIDENFVVEYGRYLPRVPKDGIEVEMPFEVLRIKLESMYAGTIVVDDANVDENMDEISIYDTTKILFGWKRLYSRFVDKLKEYSSLAETMRDPEGNIVTEGGYKYIRLEDNYVRHYIKGQRPFTAWNLVIQGTGAIIMRRALMRVCEAYPVEQDAVIPIITVHDSAIFLIKEDNLNSDIRVIKGLMEDFPYYPAMRVDVNIGDNWGIMEDWNE